MSRKKPALQEFKLELSYHNGSKNRAVSIKVIGIGALVACIPLLLKFF